MSSCPLTRTAPPRLLVALIGSVIIGGVATAQTRPDTASPAPPTEVQAQDAPNDHGHAIVVGWILSADDGVGRNDVVVYKILRTPRLVGPLPPDSASPGEPQVRLYESAPYNTAAWRLIEGEWDTVGQVPAGESRYEDRGGKVRDGADFLPDYTDFHYRVVAVAAGGGTATSGATPPAQARGQVLHVEKLTHIGIPMVVFTALVLIFIRMAQRGRKLYVRPLAGISAVDEAIGRATEMNRPVLFIPGLGAADEIPTIAALTILSRVARKVAEHRTELLVPCTDPIVMSVAEETVKQAYLDAGRPDEFSKDIVYYVTQEQFAYVAAVNGIMMRRQTATNFYLGTFYAESLILAETGSLAGSIQIAGTDRTTQIAFFVVACDYTLIGEELYAASAYLGQEPKLLGTLKAQDWAKVIFLAALIIGAVAAAIHPDLLKALYTMNVN